MRPMRRSDREIRDPAVIADILHKATVLYLGLVDDGEPYVVPMNFGFVPGHIYLHSAREGRKVDVLRANPRVSFTAVVDPEVVPGKTPCACSMRYQCVMGTGRAAIVEDDEERRRGLDALMSKFAQGPFTYDPQSMARVLVIRIDIESLSGKQAGH